MKVTPVNLRGYDLMHRGILAFSAMESTGVRIDTEYLEKAVYKLKEREVTTVEELQADDVWRAWRKRYGASSNLGSREQLGAILFDKAEKGGLGYPVRSRTPSGLPSTDQADLEYVELPFVQKYLRLAKYQKARGTWLKAIADEVVDGLVHPTLNLHTATTYRSSCDSPPLHQIPVRDEEISRLVRRCFIARPGHVLVENDFKGIEVAIAACYHQDPVMMDYIKDPKKDMHRDMAMQIYGIEKGLVTKAIRHAAKNKFVFPQFYGSFYAQCAPDLWEVIDRHHFKGFGGIELKEHMRDRLGIYELGACDPDQKPQIGTFERHLQQVEEDFWGRRFKVYEEWKGRFYRAYLEKGEFTTLTGFRIQGTMRRNQVINYGVQGSAFHCLLWTLVHAVLDALPRYGFKSKIVLQIHDSILGDVLIEELDDYVRLIEQIATQEILKVYEWINVPLVIECEISPPNATWYHKRPVTVKPSAGYTYEPKGAEPVNLDTGPELVAYLEQEFTDERR